MLLKKMLEIPRRRHYNNGFRIRTTDKFLCRRQLNFRLKKDGEFLHQAKARTISVSKRTSFQTVTSFLHFVFLFHIWYFVYTFVFHSKIFSKFIQIQLHFTIEL